MLLNPTSPAEFLPVHHPGSVSRNFSSLIRIKDGELVLLGGLEKKSKTSSSSGVPILSRIPVIKWFFFFEIKSKRKFKA